MIELIRKIESKILKHQESCWTWKGAMRGHDVPDLKFKGQRVNVREFLYGLEFGMFPPQKVYRTCLNCLCVNPLHMSLDPDRRSVIAKLYDDEDHNNLNYDPETGEIRRGFLAPKKTTGATPHDEKLFFEGDSFGQFVQAGKELKETSLTRHKKHR